jgi:subtilase family serine protease
MNRNRFFCCAAVVLFLLVLVSFSLAQSTAAPRITRSISDADVALVPGGVHPHVARAVDQGVVSPKMPMQRMAIFFKPIAAQQSDLDRFLQQQQDPNSPNYHQWLTPEQYANRFGMSTSDLAKVTVWLQSHGFRNVTVSRGRNSIEFDGNAGQASAAFHTPIHTVVYNGETHYANIASPQLPSAFAGAVAGITSLNNFRPRAMSIAHFTSSVSGNHFLAPGDIGTIYNINSLYNSGVKGDGQSIAVVGQTTLTPNDDGTHADIDRFRSLASLPAINLTFKKTGSPTYSASDVDEANLDLEWSGAVAPNAQIFFVYSDNALFTSLPYIVNNNLAPVISISYGTCEANVDASSVTVLTNILTQANAQGQTISAASGDNGAADCDGTTPPATMGLAVDVPASTPYVTGMGGNEFTGDTAGTVTCNSQGQNCVAAADPPYWGGSSSVSDASPTALEYIPETAWNDTDATTIAASGGGVSTLFTKPTWQSGTGVPADGQRDVPDIALSSSPNHDGYLICSQGSCVNGYRAGSCVTGTDPGCILNVIGGTSVGPPVFSGIVALLNQKFGMRLGNVNSTLYSVAGSTPSAFHDITTGNNMVPCQAGSKDCGKSGMIGYNAGTGYDQVTGLGSFDVGALAAAWTGGTGADFTLSANPASLSITHGTSGTSTIAVTATGGPLSGSVALTCTVSSTLGATTCSLNPTTVNPGQSATLTVVATSSAALHPNGLPGHMGIELSFGLAAVCFVPFRRNRRILFLGRRARAAAILRNLMLSAMGLALVLGMFACGGGGSNNNNNNFTPLNGTVTVQAVSGSLTHSVSIPVAIN